MNDYRDSMDEYVGTAPRTEIDIDELVGRGGRAQRRRRLAAASGGLALSAVAAVSAMSLLGGATAAPVPLAPASSAPATAAPAVETPEQQAARNLEVLKAAIVREFPGVTGVETLRRQMHYCGGAEVELVPYDAATFDTACPAGSVYHAWRNRVFTYRGTLTVGGVTVGVRLNYGRATAADMYTEPFLATKGERQLIGRKDTPGGRDVLAPEAVFHRIADRTALMLLIGRRVPQLPVETWSRVAADPGLHL